MLSLDEVLNKAVQDSASDIFIIAGGYLSYELAGKIRPMDNTMRLTSTETSYFVDEIYNYAKRSKEHFLENGDDDFLYSSSPDEEDTYFVQFFAVGVVWDADNIKSVYSIPLDLGSVQIKKGQL